MGFSSFSGIFINKKKLFVNTFQRQGQKYKSFDPQNLFYKS
jgi:hypothetical protein